MSLSPKIAALAAGLLGALTAASLAQDPAAPNGRPANTNANGTPETLVIAGAVDWLEQSDVSARREGVIKSIEFNVGMRVQQGQEIGILHDELARLTVTKQKLIAESTGAIKKAEAQRQLAKASLARLLRLERQRQGLVSRDELDKAVAEVNVADALIQEATEKQAVDQAEYDLAVQMLEDHKIIAPFTGIIVERHKNPEEAVRANEAVVRLGKTDKFRYIGWVPLESALKVHQGDAVQFRPVIEGADLPIERKVFTGEVTAISPELSTTGKTETYVLAEIQNPPDEQHPELELRQGMKGEAAIFLNGATPPSRVADAAPPVSAPAPTRITRGR